MDTEKQFKIEKTFYLESGNYSATYLLGLMMGLIDEQGAGGDSRDGSASSTVNAAESGAPSKKRGRPPASLVELRSLIGEAAAESLITDCIITGAKKQMETCPDGPPSIELVMKTFSWIRGDEERASEFMKCMMHHGPTGRTKSRSLLYDTFGYFNKYGGSASAQWLFVTLECGHIPPAAMHSSYAEISHSDLCLDLVKMGLRWNGVADGSEIHHRMCQLPYQGADEHLEALGLPLKKAVVIRDSLKPPATARPPAPAPAMTEVKRAPHAVFSLDDFDPMTDFADDLDPIDLGPVIEPPDTRKKMSVRVLIDSMINLRALLVKSKKDEAMAKLMTNGAADRGSVAQKMADLLDRCCDDKDCVAAAKDIINSGVSIAVVANFFRGSPAEDLVAEINKLGKSSGFCYVD